MSSITSHSKVLKTAMLLAAGLGTRMGDLTHKVPKPLLPLRNSTILGLLLQKLAAGGVRRVVINLHYRPRQIKEAIGDGSRFGLEIIYSEEPELLGTGGGIANAAKHFEEFPVLLANTDVLCELDLRDFWEFHLRNGCLATLAVKTSRDYRDYSLVDYNEHRLNGFHSRGVEPGENLKTGIYTGIQLLEKEAVELLRPRPESVIDAMYRKMLAGGKKIAVYPVPGDWVDLGTREKYLRALNQIENGQLNLTKFL